MLLAGTYLCVGAGVEPFVFSLTETQHRAFIDSMRAAIKTGKQRYILEVFTRTFRAPVELAFACTEEVMESVALTYAGPHAKQLKDLAACIALGRPYGPLEDLGNEGGVPTGPEPGPIEPRPSGDKVSLEPSTSPLGVQTP